MRPVQRIDKATGQATPVYLPGEEPPANDDAAHEGKATPIAEAELLDRLRSVPPGGEILIAWDATGGDLGKTRKLLEAARRPHALWEIQRAVEVRERTQATAAAPPAAEEAKAAPGKKPKKAKVEKERPQTFNGCRSPDEKWQAWEVKKFLVEPLRPRFARLPSKAFVEVTADLLAIPIPRSELIEVLAGAIAEHLAAHHGLAVSGDFAERHAKTLKYYLPTLDAEPLPVVFKDAPQVVAWNRLPFVPTEGPFPAWKEFLVRCGEGGIQANEVLAWIWSIFDNENAGRQCLWLWGIRGEDGKSIVLEVLRSLFSNALIGALSDDLVTGGRRFALTQVWGARFVAYLDCRRPDFTQTALFKSICANDVQPIEGKGVNAVTAKLNAKLAIASDPAPHISGDAHDRSRIDPRLGAEVPEHGRPFVEGTSQGRAARAPVRRPRGVRRLLPEPGTSGCATTRRRF